MPDDLDIVSSRPRLVSPDGTPASATTTPAQAPAGAPGALIPGAPPGGDLAIVSSRPRTDINTLGRGLLDTGKKILQDRDNNIDYTTGADFGTRVMLQRADNPNEAAKALEKLYGKGNYGQDSGGSWWIKQDGKQIAVLPRGLKGAAGNVASSMTAGASPIAGAIAGAGIGEMVFPFGGAIPGAMIGAASGKALDDFTKWAQGVFSKNVPQTVSGMLHEGWLAGLFQGAAPTARAAFNAVKRGAQSLGDVTQTTSTMAQHLASGGAYPPVGSYAPGLTSSEYKRKLSNILAGGSPKEAANLEYIDRRMRGILQQEGISKPEVNSLMTEVYNKYAEPSASKAAEPLVAKSKGIHDQLLSAHNDIRADVENVLLSDERLFRAQGSAPVTLGPQIADTIKARRIDFSRKMGQAYEAIDHMTGNRQVVPTVRIRIAAAQLANEMPPQAVPNFIKQWEGSNIGEITFAQAHALRTLAREMGRPSNLRATGIAPRNARAFATAVQDAIDSTQDSIGQQARQRLKQTDELYRKGIAVYEDATMNRIVRELKSGIAPEPGTVTDLFMRPSHVQRANIVMNMLSPDLRQQVVAADLGNMIRASSETGIDGKLKMDAAVFLRRLEQRHRLLAATYPPFYLKAIRTFANDLAAFDGKIDVTRINNPSALMNKMEEAIGAMRAADEYVKTNPLGAFVNGSPVEVDRAVARIAEPGHEAATREAARTLGIDSPEWRSVRKYAAQKLFYSGMEETQSLKPTISGEKTVGHLARYTKGQQDLLFPAGMADDIRMLAKEAKFLFPRHEHDLQMSFAAGLIKGHMPFTILRYAHARLIGWLIDKPQVMRFLTTEIRRDQARGRKLFGILSQWVTDRAVSGPGRGKPTAKDVSPAPPPVEKDQARLPRIKLTPDSVGIYSDE